MTKLYLWPLQIPTGPHPKTLPATNEQINLTEPGIEYLSSHFHCSSKDCISKSSDNAVGAPSMEWIIFWAELELVPLTVITLTEHQIYCCCLWQFICHFTMIFFLDCLCLLWNSNKKVTSQRYCRAFSIKGCLQSFIKDCLPLKVVFHLRSSSINGRLP